MDNKLDLMIGSLLHDVGKIIYRSNVDYFNKGTHSKLGYEYIKQFEQFNKKEILNSIRYHHYKEFSGAKLDSESFAYITYIADNIASGLDRRPNEIEGEGEQILFDKSAPLSTIFNIIKTDYNDLEINGTYNFGTTEFTKYPTLSTKKYTSGNYHNIKNEMDFDLINKLKYGVNHFSSLLQWTESLWQYIPSSTNKKEIIDISLYDHSKVTCALASCIYDYLTAKNISDYKTTLFSPYENTKKFYEEEAFLLFSIDFSGIQEFIFNISGSQALKSLRTRSFYLEMMLEVIVDELLSRLELSRANLLYTGGGHAYLILSNTENTYEIINEFEKELKDWFIKNFSIDLSVVMAAEPCSSNDLMNVNNNYRNIWRKLSMKLSDKKSHKYSIEDIIEINNTKSHGSRECRECLRSDLELNDNQVCSICNSIISISKKIRDEDFFVVSDEKGLILPFNKYLNTANKESVEKLIKSESDLLIYSKNSPHVSEYMTTNIWMCDYDLSSKKPETRAAGIASYAEREIGIKRLGVVRADIDNLGKIFISGIPEQYNSISRTATLSRKLSMFFKHEISNLLNEDEAKATVIYSGGDDLFIIGAWDDILYKVIEIRNKFRHYTMDKLTFSAGIGMFKPKFPVSKMATIAGKLEDNAKTGDKDQIALWFDSLDYVFQWEDFEEYIINEKLDIIQKAFKKSESHGKSFIYKILDLLRDSSQTNIARLAYLLARSEIEEEYVNQIFKWSKNAADKKELIVALEIYIYSVREGY